MKDVFVDDNFDTDFLKVCATIELYTGVQNGTFMFSSFACLC